MNKTTVNIALIRTSSLGDCVLATACLDYLKKVQLNDRVTWFGSSAIGEMLVGHYPAVQFVNIKDDVSDAFPPFDLIVDLQKNLRSFHFVMQLPQHGQTVVVRPRKRGLYRQKLVFLSKFRNRNTIIDESPTTHQFRYMVQALKSGLELANLNTEPIQIAVPSLPNVKVDRRGNIIVVAPGAAHATKQAPILLMQEVLRKTIALRQPAAIYCVGEEKDFEAGEVIKTCLPSQIEWQNLCGKSQLQELPDILASASAVLTNDSAIAHIAEAVGTPVSVLFGPTVAQFGFSPHREQSRYFSAPLGCRPCSKHGKSRCRFGDLACFQAIDTDKVASHLASNLGRSQ